MVAGEHQGLEQDLLQSGCLAGMRQLFGSLRGVNRLIVERPVAKAVRRYFMLARVPDHVERLGTVPTITLAALQAVPIVPQPRVAGVVALVELVKMSPLLLPQRKCH